MHCPVSSEVQPCVSLETLRGKEVIENVEEGRKSSVEDSKGVKRRVSTIHREHFLVKCCQCHEFLPKIWDLHTEGLKILNAVP